MKELYTKPELLVEKFASVDVMTASANPDPQPGGDIIVDDD
jgi:hypothetical protein